MPVFAGPFSAACDGVGELAFVETAAELRRADLSGKIAVLRGEIAADPVMPKDYPFYYPDEHREINDTLESMKPLAVLAVTGKHPMCGLNPFPLFNDAHFAVPHAYAGVDAAAWLGKGATAALRIASTTATAESNQRIARKTSSAAAPGRVIVCAHMDTDYGTPGALDNAVGLVALVGAMEALKDWNGPFTLEFVPFNGEDYCEASGQVAYIAHNRNDFSDVRLCVNIDDAGLRGFSNAVSGYNLSAACEAMLGEAVANNPTMAWGEPWYASDHTLFTMRGVPTLAVASSELIGETIRLTHTPRDTPDKVDPGLVEGMIDFIVDAIKRVASLPA